jgi:hypothetical protein
LDTDTLVVTRHSLRSLLLFRPCMKQDEGWGSCPVEGRDWGGSSKCNDEVLHVLSAYFEECIRASGKFGPVYRRFVIRTVSNISFITIFRSTRLLRQWSPDAIAPDVEVVEPLSRPRSRYDVRARGRCSEYDADQTRKRRTRKARAKA